MHKQGCGNGAKLRTPCIIGVNDACRVASAIVCIQLADYSADTFRTIHTVDKTGCTTDTQAETVCLSIYNDKLTFVLLANFLSNLRTNVTGEK